MGTSTSTTGANGNNPLVPPWAEEGDNLASSDNQDNQDNQERVNNSQVQDDFLDPLKQPSPRRFAPAKAAFNNYARDRTPDNLSSAARRYSNAVGGGRGAARRLASGITAGSGLISLLSGKTVRSENTGRALSLSDLQGLNTDQAIDRICDFFAPDNPDADSIRISILLALGKITKEEDITSFDELKFSPDILENVMASLLTEMIYQQILIDMGESWLQINSSETAIYMEKSLYSLVKVVTEERVNNHFKNNEDYSANNLRVIQGKVIEEVVDSWCEEYSKEEK